MPTFGRSPGAAANDEGYSTADLQAKELPKEDGWRQDHTKHLLSHRREYLARLGFFETIAL